MEGMLDVRWCLQDRALSLLAAAGFPLREGLKKIGRMGVHCLSSLGIVFSNILVICTGNICRSPIAEGLLKAKLKGTNVLSAGTGAMVGWPADPNSVEIMQEKGFDISAHRAQQATRPILAGVELILTLDQEHNDWLNGRYPEFRGKVHKILKWRENADVPDPYRQPREAFEQAYALIEQGVGDWVKRLG
jgi:protein-tyrosine phosphatase